MKGKARRTSEDRLKETGLFSLARCRDMGGGGGRADLKHFKAKKVEMANCLKDQRAQKIILGCTSLYPERSWFDKGKR